MGTLQLKAAATLHSTVSDSPSSPSDSCLLHGKLARSETGQHQPVCGGTHGKVNTGLQGQKRQRAHAQVCRKVTVKLNISIFLMLPVFVCLIHSNAITLPVLAYCAHDHGHTHSWKYEFPPAVFAHTTLIRERICITL